MRSKLETCLPPPRVKPPTPTPSTWLPTTLRPLGTRYENTSVQVSPAPISTVPSSSFMKMSLKRAIEIWIPGVDENPGLKLCPEHLIANGVRVKPSSRTCGSTGQLYILRMSDGVCHSRSSRDPLLFQAARSTRKSVSLSWPNERCLPRIGENLKGRHK
jgi:hypothetical protein